MRLLRAATLSVADPHATARRYVEWFDYQVVQTGVLPAELAAAWGAPRAASGPFVVIQPASGRDIYLRFVAGVTPPTYRPLRTFGWAALEICVEDVLAVHERMRCSPFDVIGPPRELDGIPTIYPMQVKGPDHEIVYLTQIRAAPDGHDLLRAESFIDSLFILVLACSDLRASLQWFERHTGLSLCKQMELVYTLLAGSFGTPLEQPYTIATLRHERDVFLELDQYPAAATPRPVAPGHLPPGIALVTLCHPEFDAPDRGWIAPPREFDGPLYHGGRAATLRAPDGTLVELVGGP